MVRYDSLYAIACVDGHCPVADGALLALGIDEQHPTELRTTGLFAISRNPIFLGLIVVLIGFFLLLPNALTLVVLIAGYLLIQIQIRLEETFLLQQHGASYKNYKASVRRFL